MLNECIHKRDVLDVIAEKLIAGEQNIFLMHGCNCFTAMGAGIARYLADKYPAIETSDNQFLTRSSPEDKLGKYSETVVMADCGKPFTIINAYTQYHYGRYEKQFLPDKLSMALQLLKLNNGPDITVVMPAIGCGIAGGDLEKDLMPVIHSSDLKITLVLL